MLLLVSLLDYCCCYFLFSAFSNCIPDVLAEKKTVEYKCFEEFMWTSN